MTTSAPTVAPAPTPPAAPSFAQSAWLVAEREISSKLRSKAFIISFAILFIGALALVVWAGFQTKTVSTTSVAVTADAQQYVSGIPNLDVTQVESRDAADALVASGDVTAAIVADASSPTGFALVADDSAPTSLLMTFAQVPTVELLNPSTTDPGLRYIVAIGLGIIFLLSAQLFGSTIAQSVVEEKQTRVVELLISAIPVRALLAGKVLGNTILAMGQILVLAAIAVVGLTVTGQSEVLQVIGAPLAWFAVFFLLGFILLAALFAAAAAMVSRMEDVGSTTAPLIYLIMIPYFLVIFFNDNPLVLGIMSYVPFSAPVGMPMRLFTGEAQWWEPLLSLGILAVTCVGAIWVGAKIYENSLLRMGARVKLSEALRG